MVMPAAAALSAVRTTRLTTSQRPGRRTTATANQLQYRRDRSAPGSALPWRAAIDSSGGRNVTVARNPISTATAQAGPTPLKTLNRAKTIDASASATVAADARITRPMLPLAATMASSGGTPRRRSSWYRLMRKTL